MSMIRGKKGGKGGGSHKHREDPNNLKSVSTAKVLDLVSEGEIVGLVDGAKSIYLDEVPLQNADGSYNFNGVSVTMRNGLPDQDFLPGFSSVEAFVQVGREVKYNLPITQRVQDDNLDAIVLTMEFPNLSKQNTKNGDVLQYSVQFRVRIRADEGVWQDSGVITVAGKCISSFQRSYYFKVPQSQDGIYDIQVVRVSPDDDVSSKHSITNWYGFSRVIEAKLNYPNRAVCGLTVRADQFGSNVPSRKYEVYGLIVQVPSNYDAWNHTYTTEVWDGTFKRSWTNNPAWIFYDLVTNGRYGLGRDIKPEYLDKYGLYMIGRYCDEMVSDGKGGKEPRFTFNGTISNRESAYSVLNNLAGLFNSMIYYSGSIITLVQDAPKLPVRDFTPANVVDGNFNYEGVARSARHSVFQVTYSEPGDMYNSAIEVIENPEMIQDIGWKSSEITLVGCTSRGQARRRALRDVYTEQHETETVTFAVGIENADLVPGDIIRVADPSYAGARYGGRIVAVDQKTNKVTLDAETDFTISNNWMFGFLLPDNTWIEAPVNTSGISDSVFLQNVLEVYPEVGTVWTAQCAEVEPRLFRVLSIKEDKPWQYTITALLHYDQKYDVIEKGVSFTEGSFSTIPSGALKAPVNLAAEQYLHRVGDSILISIVISWNSGDPRGMNYMIRYKQTGDEVWTDAGYTATESWVLNDTTEDTYTIQVQAIDALGRHSAWAEVVYEARGYNTIPSNPTGLTYRVSPALGVIWSWDNNPDFDHSGFVLHINNEAGEIETDNLTYRSSPYAFTGMLTAKLWAKNLAGNLSAEPAEAEVEIVPPLQPIITNAQLLDDGIHLSWTDCFQQFEVSSYRISSCRGMDTQLTQNTNLTYLKPSAWIKNDTVTVQAKDIFSNWGEVSATTLIQWYAPRTPDFKIGFNALTGAITVDWDDCRNLVDGAPTIAYYEILGTLANQNSTSGLVSVVGTHYESVVPLTAYEYGTEIEDGIEINVGTLTIGVNAVDKYGITSKDDPNYKDNTKQFKLYPPYMPTNMALTSSSEGDSVVLSWKDCERTFAIDYYQVYDEQTKTTYKVATNYVVLPARKEGTYPITIQAFDVIGHSSPIVNYNMMISGVGGMIVDAVVDGSDILIQWSIPDASFTLDRYIIKSDNDRVPSGPDDVNFDDGDLLGTAKVNYFRTPAGKAGTYTFYVWAVDVAGNISSNYASYTTITITAPSAPIINAVSTGRAIHLDWSTEVDASAGQLPIVSYDITRFWMDNSTGVLEPHEHVYGNFTQDNMDVAPLPVLNYDKYYFRVRAWDTGGNHSDSWGECDFTVIGPNTPFFNEVQVVVNAVMFWWSEPKITTFNIDRYKMYIVEEGVPREIGETDALYATRTESYNEQYTYGISAVDIAGNESGMAITIQEVDAPSGFVLYWNKNSKFDGERTNMILDGAGNMLGPVSNDETWIENIQRIGRGENLTWIQKLSASQVWAGPMVEPGLYEETINIGSLITTSKITITPIKTILEGDPTIKCFITTSQDGVIWEAWSESFQLYAVNFQYVKYKIEVTDGIVAFHNINYKLDMQRKQDFLTSMVYASDCYSEVVYFLDEEENPILDEDGYPMIDHENSIRKDSSDMGTWVPFNIKFTDVEVPISAEPVDKATGLNPMVVFEDVVNPQGFYLSLWSKKGEPMNGKIQWFALGV